MRSRAYGLIGAVLLAVTGLLAGCGGGNDSSIGNNGGDSGNKKEETPIVALTATLTGRVTAQDQSPVAGVTVSAAGQSVTTGADGRYTLSLDNPGDSAVVLARKNGYLGMSKQVPVHAGATTGRDITLYQEDVRTTFAAAEGKIVPVNGAVIDIPADAIRYPDGTAYNGEVTLSASYRNPTTKEGVDAFPQPYQGINADGATGALQTVGVIEALLFDANGKPLQLRKNATLVYPGVSEVDNQAGSIPLWWYDDARAIWVREGEATRLADGSYQGEVAHFTQWNLDVFSGNGASITACIRFQNGAASRSGIQMVLTGPGVSHPTFIGTVEAGDLTILNVPATVPMTLSIMDMGNNGQITTVTVPAVPLGGNVKLPCVTLVGTDGYTPFGPLPEPAPVGESAPASVFVATYGLAFSATESAPATVDTDNGSFSISVNADGSISGLGYTARPGDQWTLQFTGQVLAGGYVTMKATPTANASVPPMPPYDSITFTGRFPLTVPNDGPSGTWVYNGYTGPAWTTLKTQFSPGSVCPRGCDGGTIFVLQ